MAQQTGKMPRKQLDDRWVQSVKWAGRIVEYSDADVPALTLRVGKRTKSWSVRYRVNGERRREPLGTYPGLSLSKARDAARLIKARAKVGEDPAPRAEVAPVEEVTFGELAERAMRHLESSTGPKTHRDRQRLLESDILPRWGNRWATDIGRSDVKKLHRAIAGRGSPVMANHAVRLVRRLFNVADDVLGYEGLPNPAARPIQRGLAVKERPRTRYLEPDEIRAVWEYSGAEDLHGRCLTRLLLLTAQRVEAAKMMRWTDLESDGKLWRILADRAGTKFGAFDRLVPLAEQARAVLAELRPKRGGSEYVFPARGNYASRPYLSEHKGIYNRIRRRMGGAEWAFHDLRTTFLTIGTRPTEPEFEGDPRVGAGIAHDVARLVLGHTPDDVGFRHYQGEKEFYRMRERQQALEAWGAFIERLVAP